jgi:hypothetical protein
MIRINDLTEGVVYRVCTCDRVHIGEYVGRVSRDGEPFIELVESDSAWDVPVCDIRLIEVDDFITEDGYGEEEDSEAYCDYDYSEE